MKSSLTPETNVNMCPPAVSLKENSKVYNQKDIIEKMRIDEESCCQQARLQFFLINMRMSMIVKSQLETDTGQHNKKWLSKAPISLFKTVHKTNSKQD
ncbi:hypothetical protein BpHYR1_014882 [Brachionus plicatilis]|uniref:Uncharacterized protein n=1 Tax=Brachionus plicatilis TaxID=10195 RepID=A0A3M7T8U2_BRAPC|nr:hypothetical protein BpHYR1_014882 [Brachionus plicatilis]